MVRRADPFGDPDEQRHPVVNSAPTRCRSLVEVESMWLSVFTLSGTGTVRMAILPDQVNNGPVIFPLLKMIYAQVDEFGAAQSATKQDRQHCAVALSPRDRFQRRWLP